MNKQESIKLDKQILSELKVHINNQDTVIAAISGGPDSIFLLHFLKQLRCKTIVAHLNHLLRTESDKEEKFVRSICENSDKTLVFQSKKTDIAKLAKKTGKGLEETGRKERYKFFEKLAKKYDASYIITAHHADDNLETIVLNFTRGAGLKGLCGMNILEKSKKSTYSLLRPLLNISKNQITSYLKFHKISYKIDKSNDDTNFKRNFVRHKIIPELKKINPSISKTLAANTSNLKEIDEFLSISAENWINKNNIVKTANNLPIFQAKAFLLTPKALQKAILLKLHEKLIGNTQNLEKIHLDEILTMIANNKGNKQKNFGKLKISLKNKIITLSQG